MKYKEYQKLKTQIEEECRKKREALELIWKMSKEDEAAPGRTNGVGPKRGTLNSAVRKAIPLFTGEFTTHDLEERVKADNQEMAAQIKRASIASALNRLVGDMVDVVATGTGKKPSRYIAKAS